MPREMSKHGLHRYLSSVASENWGRLLPNAIVRILLLKNIHFDCQHVQSIRIKCAETQEERQQAFRLIHDAYVARGILRRRRSGMYILPHHFLPTTAILIAIASNRVVGTLSLVEDSDCGVPMESTHAAEIFCLRALNLRFAEVATLAIAEPWRAKGVAFLLYKALFCWASRLRNLTTLIIAVHPRMGPFFEAVLHFARLGETKFYQSLRAAPSLPLGVELASAAELLLQGGAASSSPGMAAEDPRSSVHDFFLGTDLPNLILPTASRMHTPLPPPWPESEVASLLLPQAEAACVVTRQQARVLARYYPGLQSLLGLLIPECKTPEQDAQGR